MSWHFRSSVNNQSDDPSRSSSTGEDGDPPAASSHKWVETSFPAFLSHISHLEKQFRGEHTVFIDQYLDCLANRKFLGQGASFYVEKADLIPNYRSQVPIPLALIKPRLVVIKTAMAQSNNGNPRAGWRHILLELRAQLHPHLRYHPNILTLIGLCWGSSGDNKRVYPQLVVEYAEHGTLDRVQQNSQRSLPFTIKQKLCYDVSKGISILHACGIIHGDIKHENILVFRNTSSSAASQPFVAKVADFGGSIVDADRHDVHGFLSPTSLYNAPEAFRKDLSASDAKQCDLFSFGLLVCRTLLDGKLDDLHLAFAGQASLKDLTAFKESGQLLKKALHLMEKYCSRHGISSQCETIVKFVLESTMNIDAKKRNLVKCQLALRGTRLEDVEEALSAVQRRNHKWDGVNETEAPGKHGIRIDSIGMQLGRLGRAYDAQDNSPGFRPKLPSPIQEGFLFEPQKLATILSWAQQKQVISELEKITESPPTSDIELSPQQAWFSLFQCNLLRFAAEPDPSKATHALWKAGEVAGGGGEGTCPTEYLAHSWLWRFSGAFGYVTDDILRGIDSAIRWAIIRGHRTARHDAEEALMLLRSEKARAKVRKELQKAISITDRFSGKPGALSFFPPKLRRRFTLDSIPNLEEEIKSELGSHYTRSRKTLRTAIGGPQHNFVDPSSPDGHSNTDLGYNPIDRIYVNGRGHGILHMAAAGDDTEAIKYLLKHYILDIDLPNQDGEETPLLCACRNGHLKTSLVLLEAGANPNGHRLGQDAPLHWISSFKDEEKLLIAQKLRDKGANVEFASGYTHGDVPADWEGIYSIPTTPLGRAVLQNSVETVKILLQLGANATTEVQGVSPIYLAALLALPDILRALFQSLNGRSESSRHFFDELEILKSAHSLKILASDPYSVVSCVVRHGRKFRNAPLETLKIIRERRVAILGKRPGLRDESGEALCMEIRLGNESTALALLRIGHDPKGSFYHRPLMAAIECNLKPAFDALLRLGAPIEAYPEYGSITPLQVFAKRPQSSIPGTSIALELIEKGVNVHEAAPGTRPPVVLAILHERFDLAECLVRHGARIDVPYQVDPEAPWITVLAELIPKHTESACVLLQTLLKIPSADGTFEPLFSHDQQLDFIASKSDHLSALHILATSPAASHMELGIYKQMVDIVLTAYNEKKYLDYLHPILGTALCQAALSRNPIVVEEMIRLGANVRLSSRPDFLAFHPDAPFLPIRDGNDGTPMHMALGSYHSIVNQIENSPSGDVPDDQLREAEETIELLVKHAEEPQAEAEYEVLKRRKSAVLDSLAITDWTQSIHIQGDKSPADLSVAESPQLPDVDEISAETRMHLMTILRSMLDRENYGTLSRAELERIAAGEWPMGTNTSRKVDGK